MNETNIPDDLLFRKEGTKDYSDSDIEELLLKFKKYAPHSLYQKTANEVWNKLQRYLTEDEEHRLYVSWEEMHFLNNKVENFYGIIHDLLKKYSKNYNKDTKKI